MNKLHKKEEDALLNKKKKREENKQKNKSEKIKVNNRNGINQYNIYQGYYTPQMQPINTQNPMPMNDYPNYLYYNPLYPQMCQFPPHFFPQYIMDTPKTLEENLNNICQRGIVNNIIGAFYIKEFQEKMKNNEKRKVPVSMVEFADDQGDNNNMTNNQSNNNVNNVNGNGNKNDASYLSNEKNNDNNIENKNDNVNNNEKTDNGNNKDEDKKEKDSDANTNINHHENQLKKPDLVF